MSTESSSSGALPASNESSVIKARRLLSESGSRSHIVVIGPFEPQLFELSPSESGYSDTTGSERSFKHDNWSDMSPPSTPTRLGYRPKTLADSPAVPTDWVAYGEDEEGYEDLDLDLSGITSSDISIQLDIKLNPGSDESLVTPTSPVSVVLDQGAAHLDRLPPIKLTPLKRAALRHVECQGVQAQPDPASLAPRLVPLAIPLVMEPTAVSSPVNLTPMTESIHGDNDTIDDSYRPDDQYKAEADLLPSDEYICSACEGRSQRMIHLLPCRDLACPSCFSSSVAAVSVTQGVSKCPACLTAVSSFEPYHPSIYVPVRTASRRKTELPSAKALKSVVMRIDNVAWDIEPHIVESFLPPNSLHKNHPHPIHICIDRRDGRTKDYLYVEVASQEAARRVLQLRQNVYMPGGRVTGGRKRAVTVSQVTHEELARELRPGSKAELLSLLELCEATLTTPSPQLRMDASGRGRLQASVGQNGKVHYIKYRHAPFDALISLIFMTKMLGRDSPAYWDVYHIATGAISALTSSIKASSSDVHGDRALLNRLIMTFDAAFDKTRKGHRKRG